MIIIGGVMLTSAEIGVGSLVHFYNVSASLIQHPAYNFEKTSSGG